MYDVVVIGGGVIGGMTARALSRYSVKVCILEKEYDVAMGASKANSAIVHAGFDAKEGSLKAKLNVKGSEMMEEVARELGVKYKRNGSLIVGFDEEDKKTLKELYERGIKNKVKELKLLTGEEARKIEPALSENVIYALHAPTGAIICPYDLTIAAIGNAMDNGCDLKCGFDVTKIEKNGDKYIISSGKDSVEAKYVINAAGLYSDEVAKMIGENDFSVHPRRGEYMILDKTSGGLVSHTIFRTPSKMGKGILVSPTVDGNLLLGPTSVDMEDKTDKSVYAEGLKAISASAGECVNGINYGEVITSFTGLRAVGDTGDFIINSPKENFINAAGIESPGLSASPAIAEYILSMLKDMGFSYPENKSYNAERKSNHYFKNLSVEEKNEIIKKDPAYGKIVCRCETVTEGEIIDVIRRNPQPTDVDAIKRRTRSGMGRCQGGFCSPYVVEILSRELKIPYEDVTKFGGKSYINIGKTK